MSMVVEQNMSAFMRGMLEQKANGKIEAPKNIIKTIAAAYQQYAAVREEHIERIAVYAAIFGMVSGNPPYDQAELESNGLGHIANFNNFKGRSAYERYAQGYWNLVNSTEYFTKIIPAGKTADDKKWTQIMAQHFCDVMKKWEDFQPNFNLLGSQLTLYGICPNFFPHEESPIWEVVDVARFYIPTQTQVFISKLSNVSIETTYTIQELYNIYEMATEEGPWNKEALADFLMMYANIIAPGSIQPTLNIMDLQRFVSNNDATTMRYFTDTVRLVNMYQKEYTGKISHYIFSPDFYLATNKNEGVGQEYTKDFLYFENEQYESIDEALVIFTACPGEWTIHGNMGVGQKMFAPVTAVNMLDCSLVDMSKSASTPLVRTLSTGGRETTPIRFYPGVATDIGAAEFVVNTMGANIGQLVSASQYLTAGVQENAINSGDDPGFADRAEGSKGPMELRARSLSDGSFLKIMVDHFYGYFDKLILISFIRFLKLSGSNKSDVPGYALAKEWRTRCLEDGVPELYFDTKRTGLGGLPRQFREVRAIRVAGNGSQLARIMGLEGIGPIVSMFNPTELADFKKEIVSANLGVDYIPMFASSDDQGDELSGGASLAKVEDGLMSLGKEVLFSPDNDQAAHADEHMGSATAVVQAVAQQQMSPIDADKIMALTIPHLTEHIQFMSKSPQFYRETLNNLEKPYKQLMQWAQLNRNNANKMIQAAQKKQAEDAAATQQVMDEEQRKDMQAQGDERRADQKVQSHIDRAAEANQTRANIMEKKVDSDARIKEKKVELDAQVKQNATAKGRSQTELAAKPAAELSAQLSSMIGNTPSNVDFE